MMISVFIICGKLACISPVGKSNQFHTKKQTKKGGGISNICQMPLHLSENYLEAMTVFEHVNDGYQMDMVWHVYHFVYNK